MNEYLAVLIFIGMALLFTVGGLVTAYLLRVSNPSPKKNETYECGEEPVGTAWIQFNMRYYVFALLFVIFDVEAVFLFPWAVVFKSLGFAAFIEMSVFLGILVIGLVYAWKKGALSWE
ncbi:MAG: NADH-quinone oxidoreductase subunit A [Candidatus Firestonebacteria bacterium]